MQVLAVPGAAFIATILTNVLAQTVPDIVPSGSPWWVGALILLIGAFWKGLSDYLKWRTAENIREDGRAEKREEREHERLMQREQMRVASEERMASARNEALDKIGRNTNNIFDILRDQSRVSGEQAALLSSISQKLDI